YDDGPAPLCDAADLARAEQRGAASILRLLRAVDEELALELLVATAGAQAVGDDELVSSRHAALFGLLRTVALERPRARARLCDLPCASIERDAACLVAELEADDSEAEVAWRGDRRFAPALVPVGALRGGERGFELGRGGLYLLAGGLGGIGAQLGRWL